MAGFDVVLRMEKGSEAGAGLGGAEKAEAAGSWGVLVDEPGAGLKAEKALKPGGGVEVEPEGIGPRAVEFWVIEERSAGPGISAIV